MKKIPLTLSLTISLSKVVSNLHSIFQVSSPSSVFPFNRLVALHPSCSGDLYVNVIGMLRVCRAEGEREDGGQGG